jgi:hypothetical protein
MQPPNKNVKSKSQKPVQPQKELPFDKWVYNELATGRQIKFSAQRGTNLIEALALSFPDASDFKSVWVEANYRAVENVVGEEIGSMTR